MCVRACVCGLYSNAYVDDCVEFFYAKRVLGLHRDSLKPLRKDTSRNDHNPRSAAMPRAAGTEAGSQGASYERPHQPQNVWRRSGMRCGDAGARTSESAVDVVDREKTEEAEQQSRRTRCRPYNTEPDDQLDMDEVLTFLDRMNFKPSKNRAAGSCCGTANADSAGSPVASDDSRSTPAAREARLVSSASPVGGDVAGARSVDLAVVGSVQPADAAVRNATPTRPTARIPDSVVAWRSLFAEKHAGNPSAPPGPAEYESSLGVRSSRRVLAVTESGQGDSVDPLSDSAANSLLAGTVASEHRLAGDDARRDEVTVDDGDTNTEAVEGVVFSPGQQQPPVCRVSPPHYSPGGARTPRLLSAEASYYLEQEDGDVIIESSSDEDFDDWS